MTALTPGVQAPEFSLSSTLIKKFLSPNFEGGPLFWFFIRPIGARFVATSWRYITS